MKKSAIIVGSGPSLRGANPSDIILSGATVIAVNRTWEVAPLANATSMPKWPAQLDAVGRVVKAQVINMTPGSSVECFPFDAWERLHSKDYSYAKE